MARARFTDNYDYAVKGGAVTISYTKGGEYTVKRDCLTKAQAAGKAVEVSAPSRLEVRRGR